VSPCSRASACVLDMPGRKDIGLGGGDVVLVETSVIFLDDSDGDNDDDDVTVEIEVEVAEVVDATDVGGRYSNMELAK
jgi:hypothetical protein